MKKILKTIKLLLIPIILSSLFNVSCDLVKTYTEDQYMSLGEKNKDSDKKTTVIPRSNEIEVIFEEFNYIITNGGYFDFDGIPVNQRTLQTVFRIYNNGTEDLILTGIPKIEIDNNTDFSVNYTFTNSIISPNDWVAFSIFFISNATDGLQKEAIITIPNNNPNNNLFTFSVKCTAKGSGTIEIKSIGTTYWTCPAYNAATAITLVGGGGGGGVSVGGNAISDYASGGGGGSGQVVILNYNILTQNTVYEIYIGKGGIGGQERIWGYDILHNYYHIGDNGQDGENSYFIGPSLSITSKGGLGGKGATVYIEDINAGDGGIGGDPDSIINRGKSGSIEGWDSIGGDGGYNSFSNSYGSGDMSGGNSASQNSGCGGSGSGARGLEGGNGGSGYCKIVWTGFIIP